MSLYNSALFFDVFLPYYLITSPFLTFNFLFFYLDLQTGVGRVSIFLLPPLFLDILWLVLYFIPPPVVPVVRVSIYLYSLALLVGPPYFSIVDFSMGPLFGLLLVLFEPISLFLVSRVRPVLLCICLVVFFWLQYLNCIYYHRSSVITQI